MSTGHEDFTPGGLSGPDGRLETMRRLCRILGIVHDKRIGYAEGPCDCICPERSTDFRSWRSDGEALRWLEKLVESLPDGRATVRFEETYEITLGGERRNKMLRVAGLTIEEP